MCVRCVYGCCLCVCTCAVCTKGVYLCVHVYHVYMCTHLCVYMYHVYMYCICMYLCLPVYKCVDHLIFTSSINCLCLFMGGAGIRTVSVLIKSKFAKSFLYLNRTTRGMASFGPHCLVFYQVDAVFLYIIRCLFHPGQTKSCLPHALLHIFYSTDEIVAW